jgi:hypothetical protein
VLARGATDRARARCRVQARLWQPALRVAPLVAAGLDSAPSPSARQGLACMRFCSLATCKLCSCSQLSLRLGLPCRPALRAHAAIAAGVRARASRYRDVSVRVRANVRVRARAGSAWVDPVPDSD